MVVKFIGGVVVTECYPITSLSTLVPIIVDVLQNGIPGSNARGAEPEC